MGAGSASHLEMGDSLHGSCTIVNQMSGAWSAFKENAELQERWTSPEHPTWPLSNLTLISTLTGQAEFAKNFLVTTC